MSEVLVVPAVIMAINVLVIVGLAGYLVYCKTSGCKS